MKLRLHHLAARIDAMSLRERAFLFGSLALVMMAAADQLVISPSLQQQASWRSQLQHGRDELKAHRDELSRLSLPLTGLPAPAHASPNADLAPANAQLLQALTQARATHAALAAQLQPGAHSPQHADLAALLGQVLQHHRGVTLVRLSTRPEGRGESQAGEHATPNGRSLGATALVLAPTPAASMPADTPPPALPDRPGWQVAALSVAGSYSDLRAFLLALEHQLPGLRWGSLTLDADPSPPVMTLQLWLAAST